MKGTLKSLLISILKAFVSVLSGLFIYSLLAPIAYADRGYMAYGGECVLAILVTILVLYFFFIDN